MQSPESFFANIAGVALLPPNHAQVVYGKDTAPSHIRVAGGLVVSQSGAIPEILRIANAQGLRLWPLSRGRNFGYGGALPSVNGCLVVDLSELRQIDWNARTGTVTVEPGVSLQDLHQFLERNKLEYLVPVTGAGGKGSMLGNALDGGFNATPYGDHFEAITHVEGFWGNGVPFTSVLEQLGCRDVALGWKQSVGPSMLGLLRQGRFGLVTSATFRLRPKPESAVLLELRWKHPHSFFEAQSSLARALNEAPSIAGFTSAQGPLRTADDTPPEARGQLPWLTVAPVFGSRESVGAAAHTVRRMVKDVSVSSYTADDLCRLSSWRTSMPWLLAVLRAMPGMGITANSAKLGGFADLLSGTPLYEPMLQAVLDEATFRKLSSDDFSDDPDTGLLWYSALLPATQLSTSRFIDMARKALSRNGMNAAVALTMLDSRTVIARVPLVFQRADAVNARACLKDLLTSGLELDIPPQRVSAGGWGALLGSTPRHAQWESLQKALDPNAVLWPTRGAG
jgi:4-cresol dehydrogenase (hydroxylating) flavoprotein subunit